MNLLDKQKPIFFKLPYTIDFDDQKSIIDYAYANANSWSGQVQIWNDQDGTYDQTDYFGRVQITKLTDQSRKKISSCTNYNSDWINWAARLDPDLDWEWIDTPITAIVKKYIDKISHLYKKFNRVLLLVQKQGSEIPLHTDKVSKHHYSANEYFIPGPISSLNLNTKNQHWNLNKYLTLKFPLTEILLDNGSPIIEIDSKIYRYDVKNHLFAINEVDIKHGARSVDHRRGVIFLDGLLDYDALKKEIWTEVNLQNEIH